MSAQYTYPAPRVVTEAGALKIITFKVDFENQRFSLSYRETDSEGQIVNSPIVTFDDLEKANLFAQAAGGLPGDTFELKLLAPQVLRQLLPWVPDGGTVEDV